MDASLAGKTDEQLARISIGDPDAFGVLVSRYEQRLFWYVRRISSFSEEDARDVLQEVFLKAWKNLRGFDDSLSFSSWIYRVCRNHTISSFRKHRSRGRDKDVLLDTDLFDPPDSGKGADELVDEQITGERVAKALARLPKQYRDVLVLKYFEDRSYAEISDIMRKPEGTVATYLHRAKKQFASYVERE